MSRYTEKRYPDTDAGVYSRNGDERAWRAATAVLDVELGTADVELCTAVGLSDVKSNLLNTGEVLAAWEALREGEGELLLGCDSVSTDRAYIASN